MIPLEGAWGNFKASKPRASGDDPAADATIKFKQT